METYPPEPADKEVLDFVNSVWQPPTWSPPTQRSAPTPERHSLAAFQQIARRNKSQQLEQAQARALPNSHLVSNSPAYKAIVAKLPPQSCVQFLSKTRQAWAPAWLDYDLKSAANLPRGQSKFSLLFQQMAPELKLPCASITLEAKRYTQLHTELDRQLNSNHGKLKPNFLSRYPTDAQHRLLLLLLCRFTKIQVRLKNLATNTTTAYLYCTTPPQQPDFRSCLHAFVKSMLQQSHLTVADGLLLIRVLEALMTQLDAPLRSKLVSSLEHTFEKSPHSQRAASTLQCFVRCWMAALSAKHHSQAHCPLPNSIRKLVECVLAGNAVATDKCVQALNLCGVFFVLQHYNLRISQTQVRHLMQQLEVTLIPYLQHTTEYLLPASIFLYLLDIFPGYQSNTLASTLEQLKSFLYQDNDCRRRFLVLQAQATSTNLQLQPKPPEQFYDKGFKSLFTGACDIKHNRLYYAHHPAILLLKGYQHEKGLIHTTCPPHYGMASKHYKDTLHCKQQATYYKRIAGFRLGSLIERQLATVSSRKDALIDFSMAYHYYRIAAELGSLSALIRIACLIVQGRIKFANAQQVAATILQFAAHADHPGALCELGSMIALKRHPNKELNDQDTEYYYCRSANAGCYPAHFNLTRLRVSQAMEQRPLDPIQLELLLEDLQLLQKIYNSNPEGCGFENPNRLLTQFTQRIICALPNPAALPTKRQRGALSLPKPTSS